jgi:hypothetical protein
VNSGEFKTVEAYLRALVVRDEQRRKRRGLESHLLRRFNRDGAVDMDDEDFDAIGRRVSRAVTRGKRA